MCIDTMDAASRRTKYTCLRKTTRPGSNLRLRLLRETTEERGAFGVCRAAAMRTSVRGYLCPNHRHRQAAKLAALLADMEVETRRREAQEESPAAACVRGHPAGAMAPENTTQYLMRNVYEDMPAEINECGLKTRTGDDSSSLRGVFASSDSDFERYLAFQQADFEEVVLGLSW